MLKKEYEAGLFRRGEDDDDEWAVLGFCGAYPYSITVNGVGYMLTMGVAPFEERQQLGDRLTEELPKALLALRETCELSSQLRSKKL
jgi:ribosomal protein S18 acetylase RimI-like enzyme